MPLIAHITRPLLPGKMYHIYNRGNEKGTLICYNEGNYRYFLRKYAEYMSDYMDTYAYCILPDHYHLAVRIKPEEEVLKAALKDLKVIRKDAWERIKHKLEGGRELAVLKEVQEALADTQVSPRSLGDVSVELPVLLHTTTPSISHIIPHLSRDLLTELASWAVGERYRRFLLGYTHAINKQQRRRGSLMQKPFRRKCFKNTTDIKRLIRYIHHNPVHHNHTAEIQDYPWNSYHAYAGNHKTRIKREEALQWFGGQEEFLRFHSTENKDSSHYGEP